MFSYSILYGYLKCNTSQGKSDFDNGISKTQKLETSTDPINIMGESTLATTHLDFISKLPSNSKNPVDFNTSLKKISSGIPSHDFKFSSVFPDETTIKYVTMSTSLAPNSSVTPKKLTCNYIFEYILFPSLIILTIQVFIIAVASKYKKFINGNIYNLISRVSFHSTDDGEGIVNVTFQI